MKSSRMTPTGLYPGARFAVVRVTKRRGNNRQIAAAMSAVLKRRQDSMSGAIASMLAIAGLAVIVLASLLVSVGPSVSASAQWVTIANFSFTPKNLVINVGDTVTWQNNATLTDHTATSTSAPPGGSFDSGIMSPGAIYTHTFTIAGSYNYWCTIHTSLMTGTITVNGAIPEFSSFAFVVVGMMVMMLGLAYSRERS